MPCLSADMATPPAHTGASVVRVIRHGGYARRGVAPQGKVSGDPDVVRLLPSGGEARELIGKGLVAFEKLRQAIPAYAPAVYHAVGARHLSPVQARSTVMAAPGAAASASASSSRITSWACTGTMSPT